MKIGKILLSKAVGWLVGLSQNMTRRETMTGIEALGMSSANQGPTEITNDLAW
jgi:hypothetical protein